MKSPDVERQIGEARNALLSRQFEQAHSRYERLLRQLPQSAVLWFEYGNAALGLRRFEEAERGWIKALELDPRNAELIGLIGHQFQGQRQPAEAHNAAQGRQTAAPQTPSHRTSVALVTECCHGIT